MAQNKLHYFYIRNSFKHFKKSIIFFLILIILLLSYFAFAHYKPLNADSNVPSHDAHLSLSQLDAYEDVTMVRANDLKLRIEEMIRINSTVSVELRELEIRRQKLQSEIGIYNKNIDYLKQDLLREQTELKRLKISVEQAQAAQQAVQRNTPDLASPITLIQQCQMSNCFDHSRCSLTSGFPVYLYDPDLYSVLNIGYDIDGFLKTNIKLTLGYNAHLVNDPKIACIYLVLIGEALPALELIKKNRYTIEEDNNLSNSTLNPISVNKLYKLPYWGVDGRNHILINLSRRDLSSIATNFLNNQNTMCAIIVQSSFKRKQYRDNYDIVVPPVLGPPSGDVWQECTHMIPARRLYLLTFQGELRPNNVAKDIYDNNNITLDDVIIGHLHNMSIGTTQDKFLLNFKCMPPTEQKVEMALKDWNLCGTHSSRRNILKDSTFVLILPPLGDQISSVLMQARLFEGLRSGAIPVILGHDEVRLPYSDTIDWRRLSILLPKARITELHFLLRAVHDTDLLAMRRQGRLIWERHLSSVQATVDAIVASLRDRLGIPARPIQPTISQSVFNSSFIPLKYDPPVLKGKTHCPIKPHNPSPQYRRNYTVLRLQSREVWNDWGDPFNLYPQLPFDPIMLSEAKVLGSHMGSRPIGKGAGGTGKEFSEALGGNYLHEQFTIVILTYEREQILMDLLGRLYGLRYLNKVIVVWDSPKPPLDDLRWPDIGVPISVVRAPRPNSLNNRFLPFDVIETEAILSLDDDISIQHDDILFGFRVWRQHRDRIVGFPGRVHAWDIKTQQWHYIQHTNGEFSIILTSAAFFHKYYTYLYTYWLPKAIRDKVNEYMNCEDIAMNFLIAHIARKAPVKIKSSSFKQFPIPKGRKILSGDKQHLTKRHRCINFFAKVFGYTPLLNTQYQADSIL